MPQQIATTAALSDGEPRDAAVNFDTFEFYNGIAFTAFIYSSVTVQMLTLHTARRFSRQWRKITAIAENYGTRPKSR